MTQNEKTITAPETATALEYLDFLAKAIEGLESAYYTHEKERMWEEEAIDQAIITIRAELTTPNPVVFVGDSIMGDANAKAAEHFFNLKNSPPGTVRYALHPNPAELQAAITYCQKMVERLRNFDSRSAAAPSIEILLNAVLTEGITTREPKFRLDFQHGTMNISDAAQEGYSLKDGRDLFGPGEPNNETGEG